MDSCFANHNQKTILQKYVRQSPEQNTKMFEEMDKENKHGTWYYPLWRQAIKFFGVLWLAIVTMPQHIAFRVHDFSSSQPQAQASSEPANIGCYKAQEAQ